MIMQLLSMTLISIIMLTQACGTDKKKYENKNEHAHHASAEVEVEVKVKVKDADSESNSQESLESQDTVISQGAVDSMPAPQEDNPEDEPLLAETSKEAVEDKDQNTNAEPIESE